MERPLVNFEHPTKFKLPSVGRLLYGDRSQKGKRKHDYELGEEVGRGGFGIVYAVKDHENLVIKVSKQGNSCEKWKDEKKLVDFFVKKIRKETPIQLSEISLVELQIPLYMREVDSVCGMVMRRVFPIPELLQKFGDEKSRKTCAMVHPMLGTADMLLNVEGRGLMLGLKNLVEFFDRSYIEELTGQLGKMVSLVHFVGKNDLYDIEIFLGTEYPKKHIKMHLSDYDLSENYEELNDNTIERIKWSLEAVPYFPCRDCDEKLFNIF
eukprot:433537-Rhodomonas_salina.1